jgi:DNA-binding HxlR family transcriptional regulator
MKQHYNCPVQATINSISGKWKVQIIWHLSFGTLRFSSLHKKLKDVSEKMLAQQLQQLETDGIVSREVTPTKPPRVDYSLTSAGWQLIPTMQILCDWGSEQFGIKGTLKQPKKLNRSRGWNGSASG